MSHGLSPWLGLSGVEGQTDDKLCSLGKLSGCAMAQLYELLNQASC